jgi:hypothetical protein
LRGGEDGTDKHNGEHANVRNYREHDHPSRARAFRTSHDGGREQIARHGTSCDNRIDVIAPIIESTRLLEGSFLKR